jgi:hypothetical protein
MGDEAHPDWMYGITRQIELPLFSTTYANMTVRVEVTPSPTGLIFTFGDGDGDGDGSDVTIAGRIAVVTDAQRITRMDLGRTGAGHEPLDVGDWGIGPLSIDFTAPSVTIAGAGVDEETRDTLSSLLHAVAGYTNGHAGRIAGRLSGSRDQ